MDFPNRATPQQDRDFERISPTAWLVAYQRTLSDIPLSEEIYQELEEIAKQTWPTAQLEELEKLKYPEMALIWEARYKVVNHLLKAQGVQQILEVAAGFSPRGPNLARDGSVEYVELDLPKVIEEKQKVIEKLIAQGHLPRRPNLQLVAGNALRAQDLRAAVSFFNAKPIAVVSEGLLSYLDAGEKEVLAGGIHQLLDEFGGVWITPDISVPALDALAQPGKIQERAARIQSMTGVDVRKNRFDEKTAGKFFEKIRFEIERHPFSIVADELVSPVRQNIPREAVERLLGQLVAFVLKPSSAGK